MRQVSTGNQERRGEIRAFLRLTYSRNGFRRSFRRLSFAGYDLLGASDGSRRPRILAIVFFVKPRTLSGSSSKYV